ncbi:MAG: cell division protein FtsQ/DivIB [Pseudomonadota bacterium]
MRPVSAFRDPAPSRMTYRLQRLMLTPGFRFFLRVLLPLGALALFAVIYLADADRRVALGLAMEDLRRQVAERPEFQVKLMAIDGASDIVAGELRHTLPLELPASSFDLDLEDIRAHTEALDRVASASVHIRTGGVLQIDVIERMPAVVWRSRTGLVLLDGGGNRVADLLQRSDRSDLPLLAGDGAEREVPEALSILAVSEIIAPRVRGLLRVGERRWDVVLDRDQRILLPEADPVAALERVIAMGEAQDLLRRDVSVIDMRNPRRPTLRLGPWAAETFFDAFATSPGAL